MNYLQIERRAKESRTKGNYKCPALGNHEYDTFRGPQPRLPRWPSSRNTDRTIESLKDLSWKGPAKV